MVTEQDTLIYIENQDKHDASVAANAFAHKDIKNRAYINTLGADLALKYLASENIDVSNIYNIHSIKKILEEIDISDIMLPNIHIDVRVVFDENAIFIPKSHFEYNLVPDIYLVLHLAKDFSNVKFLGFFEPKLINKNNANDKYYFIEKEKLNPVRDLKHYIESFKGNTCEKLSDEELSNSERIIIAMADNDISEEDKKYLIQQLTKSAELRDKFFEYENFETLSYKAMTDPQIDRKNLEEKLSSNQVDNLTETNTQEAINNLGSLDDLEDLVNVDNNENQTDIADLGDLEDFEALTPETPENTEKSTQKVEDNTDSKTNNKNDNNNIASDIAGIAGAAIGGAAAIAGAQAAGEVLNTIDNGINLADTALNTVDTIANLADKALDFSELGTDKAETPVNNSNNDNKAEEIISFDDVDTSKLDDIKTPENNIEEEPMSLNNVELPENTVNTDFIDSIDNKISFDDVSTSSEEAVNEPAPLNIDENKISLDDINIPDLPPLEESDNFTDNAISFDDIDTSNISTNDNTKEDNTNNIIDFDDIPNVQNSTNIKSDIETDQEETTSFESLNEDNNNQQQTSNSEKDEQETSDDTADDFLDDTLTLDNLEDDNQSTTDSIDITENSDETNDINLEDIPDINNIDDINNIQDTNTTELNQEPEIVEDPSDTNNNESFGKNLLENLSSENLDDISIEDLNLDNSEISQTNTEDISSDDLLSQIDDVLTKSDSSPITNSTTEENNNTNNDFDSIPEISDLSEEPLAEKPTDESTNTISNQENEATNSNATSQQTNNAGIIEESLDTALDELLNNEEDTQQTNENETENDNIGVLFNDTDPVTDAELDKMEEFNPSQASTEENQAPTIPGAALYNKKTKNNKSVILVAAALITVIAAASAVMVFKNKGDSTSDIEPVAAQNTGDGSAENPLTSTNQTDSNVLATNTPDINAAKNTAKVATQPAKELKNTALKAKPAKTSGYMDVNKLVWDVPNTLSYSPKMQNYLRTAGKSIKLSLSADLLLATEYAYTNQVKVSLKLNKDGNIMDSKIVSSSGSTQIDNIVLQSVKDTLSVVKPPSSEIKSPDFNLSLIIYF